MDAIPKRTTQGSKLTSQQHDDIHEGFRTTINAIIASISSMNIGGSILVGLPFYWFADSLPIGDYIYVQNIVYDKNVYPELFAIYGTKYNIGGEGPNGFRLPQLQNRYVQGTYTLGDVGNTGGASSVNVTATGNVNVIVTNGAMSGALTVVNGALTGNITYSLSSNVTVGLGTLASNVSAVNNALTGNISISNGSLNATGGNIPIDGASCVDVLPAMEGAVSVIDCSSPLTVSSLAIAAELTTNVTGDKNNLASDVTVNNGAMSGTLDVVNGAITGTITSNLGTNVSVSLGSLASNVSAAASFTGTPVSVSINPPHILAAVVMKYK